MRKKRNTIKDFRGKSTGLSDKEANLLMSRVRCCLCGKRYADMHVTYHDGSIWEYDLFYGSTNPDMDPLADRMAYRSPRMKDPQSYRRLLARRRVTVDAGLLPCHSPYRRVAVRLVCTCGGWRCMEMKTALSPAEDIRFDKPMYGV